MISITKNDLYQWAWMACTVTLPWMIFLNSWSIAFLLLIWVLQGSISEKWNALKSFSWAWVFIAFFLLHVIGLLGSQNLPTGQFELEKKISIVVLPVIAVTGPRINAVFFHKLNWGFIFSCLLLIIISLVLAVQQWMTPGDHAHNFDIFNHELFHASNPEVNIGWEYFSYAQVGRLLGIHPAYFSLYLIYCCAYLLLTILSQSKGRTRNSVLFTLFAFFILMLGARFGIIVFLLITAAIVIRHFYLQQKLMTGIRYVALTSIIVLICIWVNPVVRYRFITEPMNSGMAINKTTAQWNSINLRLLEWSASITLCKKNLLTGVGTGDSQTELNEYYQNFSSSASGLTYNSHNQYLQTTLELGIVGLIAFLGCLIYPLFKNSFEIHHVVFTVAFAMLCLTESALETQKGIVFFSLFQSMFMTSESPV